jgi:tetratricopeptide (TPR) repeat protein
MRIKFFYLSIFFFIKIISSAQTVKNEYDIYLQNVDKANALDENGNYPEALKYYNLSIEFAKKHSEINIYGHLYMAKASIYFKINKSKQGIREVENAIIAGSELEVIDYDYLFSDSISNKINKVISPKYFDLIKKKFQMMKNPEAFIEVEKLIKIDQFYRVNESLFLSTVKQKNDAFWDSFKITDSIIALECVSLVKKFGWKNEMWPIMWHNRDTYKQANDFWNFMIPYINKEIDKGNLPHSFFAIYEDYISKEKTGFTIYGTLPFKVDKNTVNIKRAEVFLPALPDDVIDSFNKG